MAVYQRRLKSRIQWRSIQITGKDDRRLKVALAWYSELVKKPAFFDFPEAVPDDAGGERPYTASKSIPRSRHVIRLTKHSRVANMLTCTSSGLTG